MPLLGQREWPMIADANRGATNAYDSTDENNGALHRVFSLRNRPLAR